MDTEILDTIQSPDDVKNLSDDQLIQLAEEIRYTLINTVSKTGGHLASNLGAVELTIALHRTFDSPNDKIVWDVGHQCYTHKLLTGRFGRFDTLRQEGGISGFPSPQESPHDIFAAGHSGASISAAFGLSVAQKMTPATKDNYTVAVIGDGSFTGGLVYEGLNNAGRTDTNLIVILNDNEMSISPNVGAMAKYLAAIRSRPGYYEWTRKFEYAIGGVPVIGAGLEKDIRKAKITLKNAMYGSTFFEDMGFRYIGPIDGHDIDALCDAMRAAKTIHDPVLIHINTVKGKGYEMAEENPSAFHGISKFDVDTGEAKSSGPNFSSEFGKYLCTLAKDDSRICAVTAAMGLGTGLEGFSKLYPERFFDVGIAEEHGVTFSGGLSKGGKIPVFAVYSTFLQRCYDQILHDVSMQHLKVVLAIDRAGFVGEDGRSHQGVFDVAFLSTVPKVIVYSPSSYAELEKDLHKAIYEPSEVVAVRYPRGSQKQIPKEFEYTPDGGNYNIFGDDDAKITLVTYGNMFINTAKAALALKQSGINVKILKLNRVLPVDPSATAAVAGSEHIFFFEEGVKNGGACERFACRLLEHGYRGSYHVTAVDNDFVLHASVDSQLRAYKLDPDSIVKTVTENIR